MLDNGRTVPKTNVKKYEIDDSNIIVGKRERKPARF